VASLLVGDVQATSASIGASAAAMFRSIPCAVRLRAPARRVLIVRRPSNQGEVMSLTPRSILLLVAVILFLLVAFNVALGTVSLLPLGLAAFAAAFLLDGSGFSLRR
jgi:hypothetical protein